MSTTLRFTILADDPGSRAFSSFARSVDGANRSVDKNSLALLLQSKSAKASADATLSLARTDKTLEAANALLAASSGDVTRQLRQQERAALESAGATTAAADAARSAGGGFAALQSPMAAAVGAGVALAPVAVTLAAGLGGLGLAALSASKDTAAMNQVLGPLRGELARFDAALKPEVMTVFGQGAGIAVTALKGLQPVAASTGKALGGVLGEVGAEFKSRTWQDFFGFMERTAGPDVQQLGGLFVDLADDVPKVLETLQPVASGLLKITDAVVNLPKALDQVKQKTGAGQSGFWGGSGLDRLKEGYSWLEHHLPASNKSVTDLIGITGKAGPAAAAMAAGIDAAGNSAALAAPKTMTLAQQVGHLTDSYSAALTPLLNYTGAQITQANDAATLNAALKVSHDRIGLATAAQRASFGDAQTYIQSLLNTASAAGKSGKGVDAQISSIRQALPVLQHVRGGTRDYWLEVQSLVGWLHRLQQQKAITELVHVHGDGTWVTPTTRSPSSGPGGGHQLAAGGMVSGGTVGRDSVAAMLMPGEVVVPAGMVASGAVDHLRGMLPGFASGGIVPSYSGALKGLQPWAAANQAATISALTSDIASVMARQFAASLSGYLGPGSASYAADIATVLSAMGLPLSLVPNWERQIQTESGGNLRAVNLTDSNAQAGHPSVGLLQLIPGTFAAYAGPYLRTPPLVNYGGGFVSLDPMAQIYAGVHYADARYDGSMASVIGHGHGYDNGGVLPPGITLAVNGTGRDEYVSRTPPGGGNTYVTNVTVNAPPGTHPAQLGKEIVRYLAAYENVNGKGWRD